VIGDLTDDAIAGPFRIFQKRRGHRYSLDDVATAWTAVRAAPEAPRCLDLGCGIGSVLLMVAYKIPSASLVGLEAQQASVSLAQRNVSRNGLEGRVRLLEGDLRDPELLRELARAPFELVTGTPPYMPPERGTVSPDPQRAHARVELRGGVEDYVRAASRVLSSDGVLVVCAAAAGPDRVMAACAEVGLWPQTRRDVIPRAGRKGALFTVWTIGRTRANALTEAPLIARDQDGGRTPMAHALRRFFDLPVNEAEPPSPGKMR